MNEHIHTIELYSFAEQKPAYFNDEYDGEQMVAIINIIQKLVWQISGREDDHDCLPLLYIDSVQVDIEQDDIDEEWLRDRLIEIHGGE